MTSEPIYFGDPKIAFLFFLSRAALFIGLGAACYWLTITDNSMRKELQSLFGQRKFRLSWKKGILWIWIPCLVLLGWYYQSTLGSRFFAVQKSTSNGTAAWNLIFHYPQRAKTFEDSEITGWNSRIDWSQRSPKYSLIVSFKDGTYARSVADNALSHEESLRRLKLAGAKLDAADMDAAD